MGHLGLLSVPFLMAVPQLWPTPLDSSISSHQLTICVLSLLLFSVFSTHEQPFRDSCAVPVHGWHTNDKHMQTLLDQNLPDSNTLLIQEANLLEK